MPKVESQQPILSPEGLSDLIDIICLRLKQFYSIHQQPITRFWTSRVPGISIEDYLKHCAKYMKLGEANFILLGIYLCRYLIASPQESLNPFNIHRLAFTFLRLGHKFIDDITISGGSQISGIPATEFIHLELDALKRVNCNLYVSRKCYLEHKKYFSDLARFEETKGPKKYQFYFTVEEEQELHDLHISEEYVSAEANLEAIEEVDAIEERKEGPENTASQAVLALKGSSYDSEEEREIKRQRRSWSPQGFFSAPPDNTLDSGWDNQELIRTCSCPLP